MQIKLMCIFVNFVTNGFKNVNIIVFEPNKFVKLYLNFTNSPLHA